MPQRLPLVLAAPDDGLVRPRVHAVGVSDLGDIDLVTARYPTPDISRAQFERFVVELLESVSPSVEALKVTLHDRIQGIDGLYDFDATV